MRIGKITKKGGFTLMELLVVMAIIAIMVGMLSPILKAAQSAVKQSGAVRSGTQLFLATSLYLTDHDDSYPLAMYTVEHGAWQTWFGRQTGPNEFDSEAGLLGLYLGKTKIKDPTHRAEPYIGDQSGYGYNYGYIGSDFHVTNNYSGFPNSKRPASSSELSAPSTTVVFATSSFYNAPWYTNGDGVTYDFGFVDPPDYWHGNPNVDFRHFGQRRQSEVENVVESEGKAVVVFADGNVRPVVQSQLTQEMFTRDAQ